MFEPLVGYFQILFLAICVVLFIDILVAQIRRKKKSSFKKVSLSRLDRMKAGEKFERIVGQYLERDGWDVSYEGIEKGLCDGGIDLIGSRDGVTALIQCKFWQAHKLVHEKHLNQLRGVVEKYKADHPEKSVCGALVTTASISTEARRAAKIHEIEVIDQFRF